LKYPSTSSCVGIGRPAVIAASTPPVTRFEAPQARYPGPRLWHAQARWTGMTLDHDHVRTSSRDWSGQAVEINRANLPMIGRAGIDRSASPHPPDHHHGQPLYPRSPGMGCTVRPAAVRN
jgi:hypothetical protein